MPGAAQDAPPPDPAGFTFANVVSEARRISQEPSRTGRKPERSPGRDLDYDAYRRITFVEERRDLQDSARFRLQYAPRGFLFDRRITLSLVGGGEVSRRDYAPEDFRFYDLPLDDAAKADLGFSGFKLLSPINDPGKFDEILSFQGASFFRALGAGNRYGASARGVAVDTASPNGEEFPVFTRFWVQKPGDAETVRIYALLESESLTGAYAFRVAPGIVTEIDVEARLFPRREIARAGVAPLTSMFEFGPQDPLLSRPDYRPAVHDSEALAITLANGERVFRPLVNPTTLSISSFAERMPRGFGLLQRGRDFSAFEDLEARYDRRPSVWITPHGDWGDGRLVLVEIPTANEFNDNVVAFWQPAVPWKAGEEVSIAYRMFWGLEPSPPAAVAEVSGTRVGRGVNGGAPHFVVDFESGNPALFAAATAEVSTSKGTVENVNLVANEESGGLRLGFDLAGIDGDGPAELRAILKRGEQQVSETWLYRWSAP